MRSSNCSRRFYERPRFRPRITVRLRRRLWRRWRYGCRAAGGEIPSGLMRRVLSSRRPTRRCVKSASCPDCTPCRPSIRAGWEFFVSLTIRSARSGGTGSRDGCATGSSTPRGLGGCTVHNAMTVAGPDSVGRSADLSRTTHAAGRCAALKRLEQRYRPPPTSLPRRLVSRAGTSCGWWTADGSEADGTARGGCTRA